MTEAVYLVIWNLDETFWKGTMTEGGVQERRTAARSISASPPA